MTVGHADSLSSWELAIACLRAEVEAGRKLTPDEMLLIATPEYSDKLFCRCDRRRRRAQGEAS